MLELSCPLDQRPRRPLHLVEHPTPQKVAQLWHLQAPGHQEWRGSKPALDRHGRHHRLARDSHGRRRPAGRQPQARLEPGRAPWRQDLTERPHACVGKAGEHRAEARRVEGQMRGRQGVHGPLRRARRRGRHVRPGL